MDELENKLGAILGNPEMMEKIAAFAQTLGPQETAGCDLRRKKKRKTRQIKAM